MCWPQEELSSFPNSASSLSSTLGLSWCSCLHVSINPARQGGKVLPLHREGETEAQIGLWLVITHTIRGSEMQTKLTEL